MNKRETFCALATASLLVLSGCSSSTGISTDPSASAYGTVRISSGVNQETKIVAHLYAEALRQAGYKTEVIETGIERAEYLNLLQQNLDPSASAVTGNPETLDVVPDYAGELLMYLTDDGAFSVSYLEQLAAAERAGSSPTPSPAEPLATPSPAETTLNATSLNSSDIHSSLQRLLPEGLGVLDASAADPKHALYTTKLNAKIHDFAALSDLADYCSTLTFDMPQSYENSAYLRKILKKAYSCAPQQFQTGSDQDERAQNLVTDRVQVADLRATAPQIGDNNLVGLHDPANIFISQNITPIIRSKELPGSARDAINTVSAELTNSEITKLLKLTSGTDAISYDDAAKFWLAQSQE